MDVLDNLERHRIYRPQQTAIIGSLARMTYGELADYASRFAEHAARGGLRPGDRVALLHDNDLGFLTSFIGIRAAGGVVVPLNFRLSVPEVMHQLGDSGASAIIVHSSWANLDQLRREVRIPLLVIPAGKTIEPAQLDDVPFVQSAVRAPANLERVMYTSGTTSRPKGVMITTEQSFVGATARCVDFGISAETVTMTVAPLYHVGGLDSYTLPVLMAGGTVVLCTRFEPKTVLRLIEEHKVDSTWLPPTMLRELFAEIDRGTHVDASSLRIVLGGGEKAPAPVLARLASEWPDAGYYDAYGLTECQGMGTYLPASHSHSHMGSVGLPAFTRHIIIVDDERNTLPAGQTGEVLISGPVLSPGYWRNPEGTATAFRDGWLHTGDIGYLDEDGFLYIADRLKDMIRSGLENVASTEIERVIYQHPAVDQVAVVARSHKKWGEVPIAFVVAKGAVTADELRELCLSQLAKFKVPADVHFVDELPRTPSGKVQKHHLRDRAEGR